MITSLEPRYDAELHMFSSSPQMLLGWVKKLSPETKYQLGSGTSVDKQTCSYDVYFLYVGSEALALCQQRGHKCLTPQGLEDIANLGFSSMPRSLIGGHRFVADGGNNYPQTSTSPVIVP